MESEFTWMDGALVPTAQATVPFLTVGLHYGLGVFEGIRCYDTAQGPAVFRLPEHARRLIDSARILGLDTPYTAEQIAQGCVDVVAANRFRECYLRPLIFARGGMSLSLVGQAVGVGIAAWAWPAYLGEDAKRVGIKVNVSSYTRHHPNVMMTKTKASGNYISSALAKSESVRLGFDEAIMLDPQGYVSECTGQNLFIVRRGKLLTPPAASILEGITRDSVLELAAELGHPVHEQTLSRDELYLADEVFVCGTATEVISVREIDGRRVADGPMGPVTTSIRHAFTAAVRGQTPAYQRWLTLIGDPIDQQRRAGGT